MRPTELFHGRILAAALVLPTLLYPCFYLSSLVFDTLLGERQMLRRTLVNSPREMWSLFQADWLAALPFCFALCAPLVIVVKWLSARRAGGRWWIAPVLFGITAAIVSFALLRGEYLQILLLTALFWTLPVNGVLSRC